MYTKEQIEQIRQDFIKLNWKNEDISNRKIRQYLDKVNSLWPDLITTPKVLRYWIACCTQENFVDSLFCNQCGSYMSNKEYGFPKYCSKECRLLNHNWRKGTQARADLEDKWEEKYGCRNPLGSKEVRKKVEQTNLERYGAKHNWNKDSTVWNKIKQTNKEKYGTEYIVQSNYFKDKAKETMIEHYGVDAPMKSETIRNKIKQTNIERYGAPNVRNSGSKVLERMRQECLEKYGVPYYCMTEKCKQSMNKTISKVNKEFRDSLLKHNIEATLEHQVGWYSYDLYIKDLNLLIDINPSFTHSITPNISSFKPKSKEYHYMRFKNALVNNYKLLQIWDWDDIDKIIESMQSKRVIYARECNIESLSRRQTNTFLDKYHFQGHLHLLVCSYGLFYNDELVELMTFGKPRYNKNYEYELLRLCTKPCYSVVGGASKLLKHFESCYKPESIISYCDLSKFSGEVYSKLGFVDKGYSISKHWYNYHINRHITDNLLRQLGADRLLGTDYGKGTSNEEIMLQSGFIEVYDAGQKTFVKTLN